MYGRKGTNKKDISNALSEVQKFVLFIGQKKVVWFYLKHLKGNGVSENDYAISIKRDKFAEDKTIN